MNYSLLAIPQAVTDNLKYIFIGVCAFAGLIALISGLIKGFYRTSRRWIKFAAVLAAFFFAYRKYAGKINFEQGALKDKIPPCFADCGSCARFSSRRHSCGEYRIRYYRRDREALCD